MSTLSLFHTSVYKSNLPARTANSLNRQLLREIEVLTQDDLAGIEWSAKNYRNGFTSYASANQMHKVSPTFAELELHIRKHVAKYITSLKLNIKPSQLSMTTCWVNVMGPNSAHSMHIHPQSIISGTYYLQMPKNSSAIKFEDPRYLQFMSRPPVHLGAGEKYQTHISLPAKPGDVVLFESWIKHEVPINTTQNQRISISFNY